MQIEKMFDPLRPNNIRNRPVPAMQVRHHSHETEGHASPAIRLTNTLSVHRCSTRVEPAERAVLSADIGPDKTRGRVATASKKEGKGERTYDNGTTVCDRYKPEMERDGTERGGVDGVGTYWQ